MLKKIVVKICLGSSCFSRGNKDLIPYVQKYLQLNNIEDKVDFSGDHCANECKNGPNIRINGKVFQNASINTIKEILDKELRELL